MVINLGWCSRPRCLSRSWEALPHEYSTTLSESPCTCAEEHAWRVSACVQLL
jgi:hypothetical protein